MVKCPYCKLLLEDDVEICPNCDHTVTVKEKPTCKTCGAKIKDDMEVCPNCGTFLKEKENTAEELKDKKFRLSKKLVIIGSSILSLIIIVAIVLLSIFREPDPVSYLLYIKDGEIHFSKTAEIKPFQVTSKLFDYSTDFSKEEQYSYATICNQYVCLSKNGKTLVFADNTHENEPRFNIYYRDAENPENDAKKIDSDVWTFKISDNGEIVTYLKGASSELYKYDLSKKEKIADEVVVYEVSNNGEELLYLDKSNRLYLKKNDEDKERIDSNVTGIVHFDEEFETIYYLKDNDAYTRELYKCVLGKDKEKIDTNVTNIAYVYDSGEMYYTKSESAQLRLADFVIDDCKEEDEAVELPERPIYPAEYEYDNPEDYKAAVEKYNEAYAEYQNAKYLIANVTARNDLRRELDTYTIENMAQTLCYYDGEETEVVSEFCQATNSQHPLCYEGSPIIHFTEYDVEYQSNDGPKFLLSQFYDIEEVEIFVRDSLFSTTYDAVAVKHKKTKIDAEEGTQYVFAPDGSALYFCENNTTLMQVKISGDKISKPKICDKDIYSYDISPNNDIVTLKNVDNFEGDLYFNKKKIDSDVSISTLYFTGENNSFIYMADYSMDNQTGTLKIYENGKVKTLGRNVINFDITPDNEISYLCNYDFDKYEGKLYLYKNGKSHFVDDGVSNIINVYNPGDLFHYN